VSHNKKIIPDEHNVIRHCNPEKLEPNGRPSFKAFMMREKDMKNGLSVSWLEFYKDDFEIALNMVRKELQKRDLRKSHRLIRLNIKKTKEFVKDYKSLSLEFFTYENQNDSHSYISGYTLQDKMIAYSIAESVSEENVFLAIKD